MSWCWRCVLGACACAWNVFVVCCCLCCQVGVVVVCFVVCFRRAGSSVVELSIAARRVTGSNPVSRLLLLPRTPRHHHSAIRFDRFTGHALAMRFLQSHCARTPPSSSLVPPQEAKKPRSRECTSRPLGRGTTYTSRHGMARPLRLQRIVLLFGPGDMAWDELDRVFGRCESNDKLQKAPRAHANLSQTSLPICMDPAEYSTGHRI